VEFGGTGSGLSPAGLRLGYLEHRVVDGAWCFYLRLWGLPQSALLGRQAELARLAVDAVKQSVSKCLAIPAAAVVKPTQLHLLFEVGPDGVIPKCHVDPVDGYSFSAGRWWARLGPA